MKTLCSVISAVLLLSQFLDAHHGPGMRGYKPSQTVVISGLIMKCFECSNRSKGHGWLQIRVDSVIWEATLPDTPGLRRAKVSLAKLKPGTSVKLTGFAHQSKAHNMYTNEIIVNGRILGTGLAANK